MGVAAALGAFQGVQAVQYNLYTVPKWQAALVDYAHRMAPAEQKVALKLREIFHNIQVGGAVRGQAASYIYISQCMGYHGG